MGVGAPVGDINVPCTVNEAVTPLYVLTRFSGLPGGVHVWPIAGAAPQFADVKTPGLTLVEAIENAGAASNVMKVGFTGAPAGTSAVVIAVPFSPLKIPVARTLVQSIPVLDSEMPPDCRSSSALMGAARTASGGTQRIM